ncbi:hypothetical protein ACET3Z_024192 [Daucus carota]
MENGESDLVYNLAGLAIDGANDNGSHGLFQVIRAVEAAEAAIRQQVEENNRLRSELLKKNHESEKYQVDDSTAQNPHAVDDWDGFAHRSRGINQSNYHLARLTNGYSNLNNSYPHDISGTLGPRKGELHSVTNPLVQDYGERHFESRKSSEARSTVPSGRSQQRNGGISQHSGTFTASFSPSRYQIEGEDDLRKLMAMADIGDPDSSVMQDLTVQSRENEVEISQLRKHLAEYSAKEAQLHDENSVLEKRIAYMRMAFDQQQQELADAASRAISYRQEMIEENIRLSYALQEAEQERSTYVSSLVPVISEYLPQPPVDDALSIVGNIKVIFKHLQEQINITETKLKQSQYQLTPCRSDTNLTSYTQSPSHSFQKNGLDLVAQPSGPSKVRNWDILDNEQRNLSGVAKTLETDDLGRYSPPSSSFSSRFRDPAPQGLHKQLMVRQSDSRPRDGEITPSKQVKFSETISSIEINDPDMEGHQLGIDPSPEWSSRSSPYTADNHVSSYSPFQSPVHDESFSSSSEDLDDGPLPAVEGLQISGEAFPGRELLAAGYSINGTTSCNFEWVRHLEDGSINYIEGAKQPNYLVTADDVDTYLAVEVLPLNARKRKGELVKVFANEHRKITCDPQMQNIIRRNLHDGQVSYGISQSLGYLDIWEPATLVIKKEGFSIKGGGSNNGLLMEKFLPAPTVIVPCGHPTEFSIIGSSGVEHLLRAENNPGDIDGARDTIVLTLRIFIVRATTKKKGKKRPLFFHK